MFEDLRRRLSLLGRLILGDFKNVVGTANVTWLINRCDHYDWRADNITRLREMLPTSTHWLLRHDDPDTH